MKAAVLWEPRTRVEILDVELAAPKAGEVLVRIAACGVCASDLHVVDGDLPEPLPIVLGHEASGVVLEAGPGVEHLKEGDHVVLALVPSCGECTTCRSGRPTFCDLVFRRVRGRARVCRRGRPPRRPAPGRGPRRLRGRHRLRRRRQHG
jgi:S-(hydroxymethyl)glutathione dehydrogenase/alcohol dehydrogenase